MKLGYHLSSEEHGPNALVRHARRAEEVGFDFAFVSDHFHPWIARQGESPFVWSVVGAVGAVTRRLELATAVTCPTIRLHPAVVAQAAATAAAMMPGRFALGLGTGEALNEHVTGRTWPSPRIRLEMLDEAIHVIRLLWSGGMQSHRGRYYTVDRARLFTLPETPPPILVAAAAPQSIRLAARAGDGLIGVTADADSMHRFQEAGGAGKPRYAKVTVCWARTEAAARRTALEWWPNAAVPGRIAAELATPGLLADAASAVDEAAVAEHVVCGPDPERHVEALRAFARAGFDHLCIHQVGPDQERFLDFCGNEILPRLRRPASAA